MVAAAAVLTMLSAVEAGKTIKSCKQCGNTCVVVADGGCIVTATDSIVATCLSDGVSLQLYNDTSCQQPVGAPRVAPFGCQRNVTVTTVYQTCTTLQCGGGVSPQCEAYTPNTCLPDAGTGGGYMLTGCSTLGTEVSYYSDATCQTFVSTATVQFGTCLPSNVTASCNNATSTSSSDFSCTGGAGSQYTPTTLRLFSLGVAGLLFLFAA